MEENITNEYKNISSSTSQELCRACLNGEIQLTGIFEKSPSYSNTLAKMYTSCTRLEVVTDDGLPLKLCEKCIKMLTDSHGFIKQCADSEEKFRRLFINVKTEEELQAHVKIEPEVCLYEVKGEESIFDEQIFKKTDDLSSKRGSKSEDDRFTSDIDDDAVDIKCENDDDNAGSLEGDDPTDLVPLSLHARKKFHKRKMRHTCPECHKVFDRSSRLAHHIKLHGKEIQSKYANKKFNKDLITCEVCQKSFSKYSGLVRHMTTHNAVNKPFECTQCFQRFKREDLLVKHGAVHMVDGPKKDDTVTLVSCEKCPLQFTSKHAYSSHMRIHKGDKEENTKFSCKVCDKSFPVRTHLNRHMKIHSDIKPHKCNMCDKSYSRQDQLIEHINKHKGVKPNVCTFCDKGFSQLCNLKDHLRTHTGETPYLCSECGKGFNNGSNLRQHLLRHTGLKPFKCNLCPKSFNSKGQLTCHIGSHSGAHPYVCDTCGHSFTKPNSLTKHKTIHLGIKPFECDVCNMRFAYKDLLKRHYRIHTGEKPYQCKFCERSFTQSNDLVKHTRTHVGENIYQCKICQMKFRLLSELKNHYPIHYTSDPSLLEVKTQIENKAKGKNKIETSTNATEIKIINI